MKVIIDSSRTQKPTTQVAASKDTKQNSVHSAIEEDSLSQESPLSEKSTLTELAESNATKQKAVHSAKNHNYQLQNEGRSAVTVTVTDCTSKHSKYKSPVTQNSKHFYMDYRWDGDDLKRSSHDQKAGKPGGSNREKRQRVQRVTPKSRLIT